MTFKPIHSTELASAPSEAELPLYDEIFSSIK